MKLKNIYIICIGSKKICHNYLLLKLYINIIVVNFSAYFKIIIVLLVLNGLNITRVSGYLFADTDMYFGALKYMDVF